MEACWRRRAWMVGRLVTFFVGSLGIAALSQASITPWVIYGDDNRREHSDPEVDPFLLELAASTAALVKTTAISNLEASCTSEEPKAQLGGLNFGDSYRLCADEPFREQTSSAFCSGFLVGPDILVTAGHCVRSEQACAGTSFVFDYAITADDRDPQIVSQRDVYGCGELLELGYNYSAGLDYAVIKLDREVEGRTPLRFREEGVVEERTELAVIGHPAGLPSKIADGAWVRTNAHEQWFVANLDTYGGNSGSAVFNLDTGVVEGILVRGETDFVWDGNCRRSNVCTDEGCMGEHVSRASQFVPAVRRALDGDSDDLGSL